jgi:two-component system chemotaxis response regulator CheB
MATRDTIVIKASAGGVQALCTLVAGLPASLPAAIFIVLHVRDDSPSLLPGILARESQLPVRHPKSGERIRHA